MSAEETPQEPARGHDASLPAVALNLFFRLFLLYFFVETFLMPGDPRFAGKALLGRNLVIVLGFSMLFPFLHWRWIGKPWRTYPFRIDNLYLSIFWLDMAGNSLGLYDNGSRFDLLAHFHGPGAAAMVFRLAFGATPVSAAGAANTLHIILEAQEFYGDVYAGTHNVHGEIDIVNDLLAGVLGSALYTGAPLLVRRVAALRTAARPPTSVGR